MASAITILISAAAGRGETLQKHSQKAGCCLQSLGGSTVTTVASDATNRAERGREPRIQPTTTPASRPATTTTTTTTGPAPTPAGRGSPLQYAATPSLVPGPCNRAPRRPTLAAAQDSRPGPGLSPPGAVRTRGLGEPSAQWANGVGHGFHLA
jgi:hypothetical protein